MEAVKEQLAALQQAKKPTKTYGGSGERDSKDFAAGSFRKTD